MTLELFKLKDPLSEIFGPDYDIAVVLFEVNGINKYTLYDLLLQCKSSLTYEDIKSITIASCKISTPKLFKIYDRINECTLDMKFISSVAKTKVENSPPSFDRKVNERISILRYKDMISSGHTPTLKVKKKSSSDPGMTYKYLDLNNLTRDELAEIASAIKIFSHNRKDPRLITLFDDLKPIFRAHKG